MFFFNRPNWRNCQRRRQSESQSAGFTLFEIILALAIASLLFGLGFVGLDSFQSRSFLSEEELIVNLLLTARSRALNNIDAAAHGLLFTEEQFILFAGASQESRQSFPRNREITVELTGGLSGGSEIVFENLKARPRPTGEIILRQGERRRIIKIQDEGRIEY